MPWRDGWLGSITASFTRREATAWSRKRIPSSASASFAGVPSRVPFTRASQRSSISVRTPTASPCGYTNTVACSAPGMFHSRPWKITMSEPNSFRASSMNGTIASTLPFVECAVLPWSVSTIHCTPLATAWRMWSRTRYLPSLLKSVWT